MIGKVLLLALLAVAACASPVTEDTSIIGYKQAIDMFLQAWKKIMPCGFAAENLPVLAPLTFDFYGFNYTNGDTSISGNVSNIRISGLNNFEILSGSYNTTTLRSTFDVVYPEIQVFGSFEIEGILSIGGFPIPVRHSVLINKKLTDWRFVGDYTFAQSLNNSNGLRIADFNLQYYVADVKVDNWDKFLDVATNNFVNDFIGSFSMLFTEEIQRYVKPMYAAWVLPAVNEQLSNLSLTQLTNYFVAQAEMWNSADCRAQA